MFELSSLGVTSRPADASLARAGEAADTSSFRSFVDALRALGSAAELDKAAEATPESDWLAAGARASSSGGQDVDADNASLPIGETAEGSAPALIVAPDQTPNRAPLSLSGGACGDTPGDESASADEGSESQHGGFSTMVGGLGEARHHARRTSAAEVLLVPTTGEASTAAATAAVDPFADADPSEAGGAERDSLAAIIDALTAERADSDAQSPPGPSSERLPVDMPVAATGSGSGGHPSDTPRRFPRGSDDADVPASRLSAKRLVNGLTSGMSTSPGATVTQAYAWRVALAQSDASAPPSAEPLPVDTAAQIVQAIRLQMTRGGGEAHIRLDPAQFGDLTVSVRVDDGHVTARVQSDTAVVRDWLQSHQGWLRQSLSDQGLTLGELEIQESSSEARDEREPGERESAPHDADGRPERRPRRSPTDGVFEVVA